MACDSVELKARTSTLRCARPERHLSVAHAYPSDDEAQILYAIELNVAAAPWIRPHPADVQMIWPIAGRGRPRQRHIPDPLSIPAEDMLANARWRTISWRNDTKGKLKARFAAVRVRAAIDIGIDIGKKRFCASQVMGLAGCDQELDRPALAVDPRVDFRREPAPTSPHTGGSRFHPSRASPIQSRRSRLRRQ
jgi:hypothetical protein